jgi:hypothetical protein
LAYRNIRSEEERREYMANYMKNYRQRKQPVNSVNSGKLLLANTEADTEADIADKPQEKTAKVKTEKKPRERNPHFDALAEVCGLNPSAVTGSEGGRIAKALADIREASPDVTPEEIRQRAANYRKVMPPGSLMTPTALSSNWTICGGAGVRKHSDAELTLIAMGKM